MPATMKKSPKRSRPGQGPANARVVALVYDGLCTFEYGIAVEMFGLPRPEFANWYSFASCAVERGPRAACACTPMVAWN
jgi:AraC family transcriptional activator FtrA